MICLHPKAILEEVATEGFVLHMGTGIYYELNTTAYRILRALLDGVSVDEVVLKTSSKYGVSAARVSQDIEQLLVDLRDYELITES